MAEPKLRFKKDDGSSYPAWKEYALDDILTERNEPHRITEDAPQLSFTIEQGVIYPEDKKTNKRDFLMKDKDNKKFLLTEYNDIIYNPANLKFGAIHRNALGRGVVSPIYAIFTTNQNPEFIEGIVTNPAFIKRSLKYLEGTVEKLKTLKPRDFVKMHVWIPCIEEQQKIADFLSSIDDVISISEQEVANLETQKKAVMKKIFSQEVRFKRDDGSDFPEWEEMTVGDCLDYEQPGKYIVHSEDYDDRYATPVLTANKAFILGYTDELDGHYDKGDVIIYDDFTMDLKYVNFEFKVKSSAIKMLTAKSNTVDLYYMYALLCSLDLHQDAHARSYISIVAPMSVEVPCFEEQYLIANFLSNFDEAIAAAKKELELWKELKKGLLQQMFV